MKTPKERPRDEKGRFLKNPPTYVIIDEFGDVTPYSKKELTFGYGVTKTKNLEAFEKLAEENSGLHGKPGEEVKANQDSVFGRLRMTFKIRSLGAETSSYYVDKLDPPSGWNPEKEPGDTVRMWKQRKKDFRNRMLDETVGESVKGLNGEVTVVVDKHRLNTDVPQKCGSKSNSRRKVSGNQYDSKDSKYAKALQTHDYVTNAGYSTTKGFGTRARWLGMKFLKQK